MSRNNPTNARLKHWLAMQPNLSDPVLSTRRRNSTEDRLVGSDLRTGIDSGRLTGNSSLIL